MTKHFKFKNSRRTVSAGESEQAVSCSEVARWIIAARPSDFKTATVRLPTGQFKPVRRSVYSF